MAKKKRSRQKGGVKFELPQREAPSSIFLDSGSFTLWTVAKRWGKTNQQDEYAYYDTEEFWMYMRHYVHFIQKYGDAFNHYANVDVIPHAELTYRNQKWLEGKGLNPIPVIHFGSSMKWIRTYLKEGYPYIAFGGLVGRVRKARHWLDEAWSIVCDSKGMPTVKVHGFGITQHAALWRYPWYSVDAASWGRMGAFGMVAIPYEKNGKWDFRRPPMKLCTSEESSHRFGKHHYLKLTRSELNRVNKWFSEIHEKLNIPLGENDEHGLVKIPGVLNYHLCRRYANMYYFQELTKALPKWPWSFQGRKQFTIRDIMKAKKT